MTDDEWRGPVLRSLMTSDGDGSGRLVLAVEDEAAGPPLADEVVLRVEASPLHPSDLGRLLGMADLGTLRPGGTSARPTAEAALPPFLMPYVAGRLGEALAVGNEGAGTVIAAGANAEALLGRTVAVLAGGMYARYRRVSTTDCVALPEGIGAADGAAMFVNPLTALAMVETAHETGHRAMIHTAAASALGRMIGRICRADGIALVNVVRGAEQAALLRAEGAEHVVDSTAPDFGDRLTELAALTGATLAFDAVGGGTMPNALLGAMERAVSRGSAGYSPYGSDRSKQLYVYGMLDPGPLLIDRGIGYAWSVAGFLLTHFLERVGPDGRQRMISRVLDGLGDVFTTPFRETLTLSQLLEPDILRAANRKATGRKYLITPCA